MSRFILEPGVVETALLSSIYVLLGGSCASQAVEKRRKVAEFLVA